MSSVDVGFDPDVQVRSGQRNVRTYGISTEHREIGGRADETSRGSCVDGCLGWARDAEARPSGDVRDPGRLRVDCRTSIGFDARRRCGDIDAGAGLDAVCTTAELDTGRVFRDRSVGGDSADRGGWCIDCVAEARQSPVDHIGHAADYRVEGASIAAQQAAVGGDVRYRPECRNGNRRRRYRNQKAPRSHVVHPSRPPQDLQR
jgi:hypothetical protein